MADEIWVIQIRPLRDRPGEPPAARRIAQLLKLALRAFRLECISLAPDHQRVAQDEQTENRPQERENF
jgi:hypothetical protein